jgi:cell wall-associated NlpC family hydrolase
LDDTYITKRHPSVVAVKYFGLRSLSKYHHRNKQMNSKTLLLVVLLAVLCYTTFARSRPVNTESDAQKFKIGKVLKGVGKVALKVGKAYANAHGVPLSDEEEQLSEKKINVDDIFEWLGKGKAIYDIFKKHKTQPVEAAEEEADKIKIGKALKSIGKGALKIGKAYVGQKYGLQLADEIEQLSEKKIKIDDIFNWIGKGKQVYDMFKGMNDAELSDKKINFDEIFEWIGKGKAIYDIFKKNKQPATEEEADKIKFGKIFKSIGKGALKVGKAYVGQKYGLQLADTQAEKFKIGKVLKGVGKVALKVGKAYANAHGVPLSETSSPGDSAASFARAQVGKGYSQAARLGPNSFDCSGLVKTAWANAGRSVPNTTSGYPGGLRRVDLNSIQPGDILWRSGHVGIYVGGGQVVNAENPRSGVQIRSLDWYQRYMGVSAVYRP